ncbi:hypothetical protein JD844_012440 [Phrynosoma platyrhinos]|uniref:Uncharacterized protein n=1 Tax=Phrynosoma platyrhinos TaxID=52577 RepID=A0ABQ7TKP6_PHRPL|nr:hypothetical protein JD844_012440 [Phrynosoma platyrhinos]
MGDEDESFAIKVKPVGVRNAAANLACEHSEDDSCAEMESETEPLPEMSSSFVRPSRSNQNRRTYDLEGLVELLNRVQSTRVNDQRGLLSKEHLVLPDFLQMPEQQGVSCKNHSSPSPAADKKCAPEATDAGSVTTSQSQEQPLQSQAAAPPPKLQTRSLSTSSTCGKPSAI